MKRGIAAGLLLLPLWLFGQGYGFRIDTTVFAIGEQTWVTQKDGGEIRGEGILLLGQQRDTVEETIRTLITCFEPGEHWLHVGDDSILLTVMDVEGVDTVSTEIKDITGILSQPYTFWEIFRWVLLALLVAALIVAGVYLFRRAKQRNLSIFIPKPEPPVPPDVRALDSLEALRTKRLWQQGRAKEYHTELTDIVRRYLEEAHGINSTEMTTGQTLEVFNASPVCTDDTYRLLRQMLETADMVKFAKSEPPAHEHERSMDAAVDFVKSLTVNPATDEGKEDQA